ncbi:hypothetical protein MEX01_21480 [Methylorubrum extorquens]|nr:hypothetical protein MEX01_21480 [Methylorubrum extorquens]
MAVVGGPADIPVAVAEGPPLARSGPEIPAATPFAYEMLWNLPKWMRSGEVAGHLSDYMRLSADDMRQMRKVSGVNAKKLG